MLGQVIHGYRVDRALSEDKGGFGDVYFATHVDSGAEAVVKVLKPEMSAQRDIVARFFNEARAAASVHHPGVVQIHNVGYHGDRAYLLMERLHGTDLEGRLAAGPLPLDRAIVFMRQAAGAIGAAHDRGIVHRDLKPANLFIVADPDVIGGERVKVLDFGIAKLTVDAGAGKTQGVFGTPAYMSPEQCASTGGVDGRADLYSLGCIFYELVCGRPPFGQGGIELIAAHLRDVPAPPRAFAPWLPPAVEQVILRLLEKQPDRRLPSCAALIAALDEAAAASGLPGASGPYLMPGGGQSLGHPASSSFAGVPHATTLGSAAGAASTMPRKRGAGLWLGIGAVVVVAGAIAVVLAMPGRRAPVGPGSDGSGSAGGSAAVAALVDAGAAIAPLDAARIAVAPPDAAPPPDAAQIAAASLDAAVAPSDAATGTVEEPRHVSQAEIAAKVNEEGKKLMYQDRYAEAAKKFEQAVARVPEAKYFINLCTALLQMGHLDRALITCNSVALNEPTPEQQAKADKLMRIIRDEAKKQGIELWQPGMPRPPDPP